MLNFKQAYGILNGVTQANFMFSAPIDLQIMILKNKIYVNARDKQVKLHKVGYYKQNISPVLKVQLKNINKLAGYKKTGSYKKIDTYDKFLNFVFTPTFNNFNVKVNIFVLHEANEKFHIDNDIDLDKLLLNYNLESIKGKINVNYKVLLYSNAQITVVPQFRILPAGIEAEHGLVIYGPQNMQEFYLNNRSVGLKQILKRSLIQAA